MTVAAAREKLHAYIDSADTKKVKELCAFVENEIESADTIFDDEMMAELMVVSMVELKVAWMAYEMVESMALIKAES